LTLAFLFDTVSQAIPLRYTPRQIVQLQGSGEGEHAKLVIVEADADEFGEATRAALKG
jgi:hypothetical protein